MAIAGAAVSPPAARREGEALALADGIELIGEYQDSGFKEPPLLARRADGQVVQLPRLSYLIAEAADGRRDTGAVAAAVSERFGRSVSPDSVQFLVDRKLRPLGVLALEDGSTPELPKRAPVMALRHRRPLVPRARGQRDRPRLHVGAHAAGPRARPARARRLRRLAVRDP